MTKPFVEFRLKIRDLDWCNIYISFDCQVYWWYTWMFKSVLSAAITPRRVTEWCHHRSWIIRWIPKMVEYRCLKCSISKVKRFFWFLVNRCTDALFSRKNFPYFNSSGSAISEKLRNKQTDWLTQILNKAFFYHLKKINMQS